MVPDGLNGRTDGRCQNYIPPTSSGDKKVDVGVWVGTHRAASVTPACK